MTFIEPAENFDAIALQIAARNRDARRSTVYNPSSGDEPRSPSRIMVMYTLPVEPIS
jgi:hypothetical protein